MIFIIFKDKEKITVYYYASKTLFYKMEKSGRQVLKTCINFVLFYSLFQKHDVKEKLSQNNLPKKLNHKPSGSTEMAHKYLAWQFFFIIAVGHGSLK